MKWSSVGLMAMETTLSVCPLKNRRKRLSYSDRYLTAWSAPGASELTSTVCVGRAGGEATGRSENQSDS